VGTGSCIIVFGAIPHPFRANLNVDCANVVIDRLAIPMVFHLLGFRLTRVLKFHLHMSRNYKGPGLVIVPGIAVKASFSTSKVRFLTTAAGKVKGRTNLVISFTIPVCSLVPGPLVQIRQSAPSIKTRRMLM
jgi:hypothetical protein